MASFYRARVGEFLAQSETQIIAELAIAYANRGYTSQYTDQTLTWESDVTFLKMALETCVESHPLAIHWGLLLEFSIPRKEMRIDAILLIGTEVVILEAKGRDAGIQGRRQVEEYALLLHYFHKASASRHITPVLVSSERRDPDLNVLRQSELFPQLATYWISSVIQTSWDRLSTVLLSVSERSGEQLDQDLWDSSPYFPVPSIVEAAIALKSGLSIREIAHSEASEHEIETVRATIQSIVDKARIEQRHVICFLTGVPGSGKTLVGLSLAHSDDNQANQIHFMSGNGPLVQVLQHLFTQEGRRAGTSVAQARIRAKTLIENVHVFARYYMEDNLQSPSNHAIIFDEAQRAWNRAQNNKKFHRDYSEPEMLLGIMGRHADWAVIVALVGGGQEINDGEAGLEEWGRALVERKIEWSIYASPEVLDGGPSTADHRLFDEQTSSLPVNENAALHLRTSNRSLRAETLATWVNQVLTGEWKAASALRITDRFPIFLSRDLDHTRKQLKRLCKGEARFGLIGSSGAARLRAEGLEPSSTFHAGYPWEHWYLADRSDLRSSFQCEVFATEFEIQGLELDWIGVCWGGDYIWQGIKGWQLRTLRPGSECRWNQIKNPERRAFRRNAYRVLLTRARQGMILFVPRGSAEDPTRDPVEFDQTADFLLRCGVTRFADLDL